METIDAIVAEFQTPILMGSLLLIMIGGFFAYKINRGEVDHSIPWIIWLVPTTAFIVALMGLFIVLIA